MKQRDWLVYTVILAVLAGCGLKRNLQLPPSSTQTQTNASGDATAAPAPGS